MAQPAITSADAVELTRIRVTFDITVDTSTVDAVADWTVAPNTVSGSGNTATPVVVGVTVVSDKTVDLLVHPELSPDDQYDVTAVAVEDSGGDGGAAASAVSIVAASLAPALEAEWPHRFAQALTNAVGRECSDMIDGSETLLVQGWEPDPQNTLAAQTLLVESTLRFQDAGRVWVGPMRFTYTGRADGALLGATPEFPTLRAIPAGTRVVFDALSYQPSG